MRAQSARLLLEHRLHYQPFDEEGVNFMRWAARTLSVLVALSFAGWAVAGPATLTKAQYIAKLRAANAASAKADDAASAAVGSKTASPARVRSLLMAMGREHVAIGREFTALVPPRSAAKANRDFAHAEIVFGDQNETIARKLPTSSRTAMLKYLHSLKPPSAGAMLDHAITELHAAGFRV